MRVAEAIVAVICAFTPASVAAVKLPHAYIIGSRTVLT